MVSSRSLTFVKFALHVLLTFQRSRSKFKVKTQSSRIDFRTKYAFQKNSKFTVADSGLLAVCTLLLIITIWGRNCSTESFVRCFFFFFDDESVVLSVASIPLMSFSARDDAATSDCSVNRRLI